MEAITEIKSQKTTELRASFEVEQAGKKQILLVAKERVVFGSVESADVKLSGVTVSPIHALLEIKWGASENTCEARLIDLASPTGVIVNGKPLVNDVIRSGDLIQIGDAMIRFGFKKPDGGKRLPDQALLLIDPATVTPIFDYRPATKEALEVVSSWNGVILNVKHFVAEESVSLGATGSEDFQISRQFAKSGAWDFISKQGGQWMLRIESNMKGVLYLEGKLHSVADLIKARAAQGNSALIPVGENDFVKIQIGLLSFYVSRTAPPPELTRKAEFVSDPFLGRTLLISLVMTALLLFGVSKMEVVPPETLDLPPEVGRVLYHPEKYSIKRPTPLAKKSGEDVKKMDPPKKVEIDFTKPKEKDGKSAQVKSVQPGKKQAAQDKAKEGAGARAQGTEGSRGAKNAPQSSTRQAEAKRASPLPGDGRGGAISQSADNGTVQMMKGATDKILNLMGASGQKLGASGSKIQGFGGFSTAGAGGAALQGGGKGGGGDADTLLGGTGTEGRGGGKIGTGLGPEGTGTGIIGGKTRIDLNVGGGKETVVIGSIDRDAIDAAIRAHRDEFRYCYEREVNAGHPNLAGKIVTAFVIGGSGRASLLSIASSSMESAGVEKCVLEVIGRIQFPQPAGGVPVSIKYPFAYKNASK
ncbi:MAG: AgmX/PglI C-terminal domain-containing protein [Bdellovibrionales bacterium]|nr:AgmX/PglI C-terminal domain-containing protein [Bdellovibrionales bacterium]